MAAKRKKLKTGATCKRKWGTGVYRRRKNKNDKMQWVCVKKTKKRKKT